MDRLQLDNKLSFAVEPYKRKLRFIVYDNKSEFVCRIEALNKIEQFLKLNEARIFKGRLQLYKMNSKIYVEVKRNPIGFISVDHFTSMLQKAAV
ncbi:hypothetical protein [Lacibacter sp. H407]|uniref:hypothetical protein n=1 Tax=Lacibacter sp. H407 TaxID=3133423 RepID=UPI0030C4F29C